MVSALIVGAYELGKDASNEPGTVRVDAGALDALLYDLSRTGAATSGTLEDAACEYFNEAASCDTCRAFTDDQQPCGKRMFTDIAKRIYEAVGV